MNKDFYPTPTSIASLMKSKIKGEVKTILEPSAGKGDLIGLFYNREIIDAIEIESYLRDILKFKNINVIHDDFLTFESYKKYDLIFANFPFSDGDKHLLKAIQLQEKNGGQIVCLLNAETIKNPFSNTRQILIKKLEQYGAEIEYVDKAFTNAERTTEVEVALISLTIPDTNESLILESLRGAETINVSDVNNTEIVNGETFIDKLIVIYKRELEIGIALIREYSKIKHITTSGDRQIIKLEISGSSKYQPTLSETINDYAEAVRAKYWNMLIGSQEIRTKYTENILNELRAKLVELQKKDFSHFNIKQTQIELTEKVSTGVNESIIKLFDYLSYQYSYNGGEYEKNVHYFNGWKTNKSYKINTKVIVPMNGYGSYSNSDNIDVYKVSEKVSEIIKVLQYLDGKNIDFDIRKKLNEIANDKSKHKNVELPYITISFFKKGTCHIVFQNKDVLDKLNIIGALDKNWLPPSYGKKKYSDFTQEEKNAVDGFQTKEEYQNILLNNNYYLQSSNLLLN